MARIRAASKPVRTVVVESFTDHLSNEWHVIEKVASNAPSAIFDAVKNDIAGHPEHAVGEAILGGAAGAGTAILAERAPYLTAAVIGGLALYQVGKATAHTIGQLKDAWNADTNIKQEAIADRAIDSLSRHGADLLESMPAFIAGGYAGDYALSRSALLNGLATKVTENFEFPFRRYVVPESLSWLGPGSARLAEGTVAADGSVNALSLAEALAKQHPWKGVEVARSVDLNAGKMSRALPGTADEVSMGFADRTGRIPFHTHNPEGEFSSLPSIWDIKATKDLGIIQSGDSTTFYIGRDALQRSTALDSGTTTASQPLLKALVYDRQQHNAFMVNGAYDAVSNEWSGLHIKPLDLQATANALSRLLPQEALDTFQTLPGP